MTVDLAALPAALKSDPAARDAIRREVLTEDHLAVPGQVESIATLRRRHRPGVTPTGEQAAWSRVSRRLFLWDLKRAGERARFVDAPRAQSPSHNAPAASLQDGKNPSAGGPAPPSTEGFAEQ